MSRTVMTTLSVAWPVQGSTCQDRLEAHPPMSASAKSGHSLRALRRQPLLLTCAVGEAGSSSSIEWLAALRYVRIYQSVTADHDIDSAILREAAPCRFSSAGSDKYRYIAALTAGASASVTTRPLSWTRSAAPARLTTTGSPLASRTSSDKHRKRILELTFARARMPATASESTPGHARSTYLASRLVVDR